MSMSFENLTPDTSKIIEPGRALGGVLVEASEKMLDMQMNSCKGYSDIAFGQLKKMTQITNVEQASDFLLGQIEPLSQLNKQLLGDCKSVMSFNTELANEVKGVFSKKLINEDAAVQAGVKIAPVSTTEAKPDETMAVKPAAELMESAKTKSAGSQETKKVDAAVQETSIKEASTKETSTKNTSRARRTKKS